MGCAQPCPPHRRTSGGGIDCAQGVQPRLCVARRHARASPPPPPLPFLLAAFISRTLSPSLVSPSHLSPLLRARTDRFYRLPEDEKEEGDYSLRDAFPTGRYALKDPIKVRSKGFLAARDDPNAERVSYLQIPLYNKEGGWGQLDNDMPHELAQEVMHSLNIQALETI